MNKPVSQGMSVACPSCHTQFNAPVQSVVDGARDPQAKSLLLSKRLNVIQCPNCRAVMQLSLPLVYFDGPKELMAVYFPVELNLPVPERERIIGEMTRAVMNGLPPEERKGYLFNPVQPLTLDGLIELILNKDGITPEMIAAQKRKLGLVERFLEADPVQQQKLLSEHSADLDEEFFQLMTLAAESALGSGQREAAEAILMRRDILLRQTPYGQQMLERAQRQEAVIREVASYLESLGEQVTLSQITAYIIDHSDSDDHLQALIAMARSLFSPQFFAQSEAIVKAEKDAGRAQRLKTGLGKLATYAQELATQDQLQVQAAQSLIQSLLNAPNMEEAVRQALPQIDDLALQVLLANIQAAEQRRDLLFGARLKTLHEEIMRQLRVHSPAEVQFLNELLSQDDDLEARLLLTERAKEFGPSLLDYMDTLIDNLDDNPNAKMLVDKLRGYRQATEKILAEA
jgi:hypothetical protein